MTTNNTVYSIMEKADRRAEEWIENRLAGTEHPHVTPLSLMTIIVLLALGVLGIISPAFFGAVAPMYIGTLMIIAGATFILMSFEWPPALNRVMLACVGGLGIASGILMYFTPSIGLFVFSLILGLYFLFEGVMKLFSFPRYSTFSYTFMFISGIISAGLGIVIAWISAFDVPWVSGFLFGIDLCIGSIAFFLTLLSAQSAYDARLKNRNAAEMSSIETETTTTTTPRPAVTTSTASSTSSTSSTNGSGSFGNR